MKHGMPRTILIAKVTNPQHGVRRRDGFGCGWMVGWKRCEVFFCYFLGDVEFCLKRFFGEFFVKHIWFVIYMISKFDLCLIQNGWPEKKTLSRSQVGFSGRMIL